MFVYKNLFALLVPMMNDMALDRRLSLAELSYHWQNIGHLRSPIALVLRWDRFAVEWVSWCCLLLRAIGLLVSIRFDCGNFSWLAIGTDRLPAFPDGRAADG